MARIIPKKIQAGVDFRATFASLDMQALAWSSVLLLRGPVSRDFDADREGSSFAFDLGHAETATLPAGVYAYSIRATNGDAKVEVESGTVEVLADLAAATAGYEARSQAAIALEAIDAVLAKRATMDQSRYKINNRELDRTPIPELLRLRTYYASKVSREKAQADGKSVFGKQVKITMGRAC